MQVALYEILCLCLLDLYIEVAKGDRPSESTESYFASALNRRWCIVSYVQITVDPYRYKTRYLVVENLYITRAGDVLVSRNAGDLEHIDVIVGSIHLNVGLVILEVGRISRNPDKVRIAITVGTRSSIAGSNDM